MAYELNANLALSQRQSPTQSSTQSPTHFNVLLKEIAKRVRTHVLRIGHCLAGNCLAHYLTPSSSTRDRMRRYEMIGAGNKQHNHRHSRNRHQFIHKRAQLSDPETLWAHINANLWSLKRFTVFGYISLHLIHYLVFSLKQSHLTPNCWPSLAAL